MSDISPSVAKPDISGFIQLINQLVAVVEDWDLGETPQPSTVQSPPFFQEYLKQIGIDPNKESYERLMELVEKIRPCHDLSSFESLVENLGSAAHALSWPRPIQFTREICPPNTGFPDKVTEVQHHEIRDLVLEEPSSGKIKKITLDTVLHVPWPPSMPPKLPPGGCEVILGQNGEHELWPPVNFSMTKPNRYKEVSHYWELEDGERLGIVDFLRTWKQYAENHITGKSQAKPTDAAAKPETITQTEFVSVSGLSATTVHRLANKGTPMTLAEARSCKAARKLARRSTHTETDAAVEKKFKRQ
jgi:hypothetical protein